MGLGMTHGPMLFMHDSDMTMFLRRGLPTKASPRRARIAAAVMQRAARCARA